MSRNHKNKKLNILVLVHVQTRFGGYGNILEFCQVLAQMGHNVTYVSTSRKNRLRFRTSKQGGVTVVESPDLLWGKLRNGADPFNGLRRALHFMTRKVDLIYGIDSRPSVIIPCLLLKFVKRVPFVQDWHDSYGHGGTITERSGRFYSKTVGHVETFFEEFFRKYADYGVVATSFLKERLVQLGFPGEKIHIHRVGSIPKEFTVLPKPAAREKFRLDPETLYLGYLGGIYKKDAEFLFQTVEELIAEGVPLKVLLIGRSRLPARQIQEKDYLEVTGELSEDLVFEFLQACDGLLLPFKASPANLARWPSKVNHYMLSGRPIISTPISDFRAIFQQHDVGILAKDDSVSAFKQAIRDFVAQQPRWTEFGANSQKYFAEHLDYRVIASQFFEFLDSFNNGALK